MEITVRDTQSLYSGALQFFLRPFRPRFASTNKVLPAGSNHLEHGLKLPAGIAIEEKTVGGLFVYEVLRTGDNHVKTTKRLYYIAGGGWQMPPSAMHWKFALKLVQRVPGLVVCMVSTPLAPKSPAAQAFPELRTFMRQAVQHASDKAEKVLLGGDSSGGNLALALVLDYLEGAPAPGQLVGTLLICPSVDLREMTADSESQAAARKDAVLTMESHNAEAVNWTQGQDRAAAWISPINGRIQSLSDAHIKVLGITAGWDLLSFDALRLRDRCQKTGVDGAWLHWDKQMHCFPMTFMYRIPEAVAAMDWIVGQIEKI